MELENLYRQYMAAHDLARYFNVTLGMPDCADVTTRERALKSLAHKAEVAGMNRKAFLATLQANRQKALEMALARWTELREHLAAVEPSVEKAQSYFGSVMECEHCAEVLVLFKESGALDSRHPRTQALIQELEQVVGKTRRLSPLEHGMESFDYARDYRLLEEFAPHMVPGHLEEIEAHFREQFLSAYMQWAPDNEVMFPDPNVEDVVIDLWLCARSHGLSIGLHREIELALSRLPEWIDPDGAAVAFYRNSDTKEFGKQPAVRVTALTVIAFLRLGDDRFGEMCDRAARWLCAVQNADGSWAEFAPRSARPLDPAPRLSGDVLTTTLVLESLRRSGLEHVERHLERGETWLLRSQHPVGLWSQRPYRDAFMTATVLSYFDLRSGFLPRTMGYLSMARDFFRRAERLALDGGHNARREAAILATHAVEMFLYGAFQQLDMNFYKQDGKQDGTLTLGLRQAMTQLETKLNAENLKYRTQINDLVGRRDGIIHRAGDIDDASLKQLLDSARGL
jgi:hypothetical protein